MFECVRKAEIQILPPAGRARSNQRSQLSPSASPEQGWLQRLVCRRKPNRSRRVKRPGTQAGRPAATEGARRSPPIFAAAGSATTFLPQILHCDRSEQHADAHFLVESPRRFAHAAFPDTRAQWEELRFSASSAKQKKRLDGVRDGLIPGARYVLAGLNNPISPPSAATLKRHHRGPPVYRAGAREVLRKIK